MAKIIAVCGKICSGKTTYARELASRGGAVVLSCDELMIGLFHHKEGDRHDEYVRDVKKYLHKKAAEIVGAGCDVILDWGFWRASERREVRERYGSLGIGIEWHGIDITDADWMQNVAARNAAIESGDSDDYFIDEGLMKKFESMYESPGTDEIDIRHVFVRE